MGNITIHEALSQVKLLDKKISKKLSTSNFVAFAVKGKTQQGLASKTFIDDAKSAYKSIQDMTARRHSLKMAIMQSNAETTVAIGDKTMTVAEAIAYKDSIKFEKTTLSSIRIQSDYSTKNYRSIMDDVESRALQAVGGECATDRDAVNAIIETYKKNNTPEILDPIKVADEIERLEKVVYDFESQIDVVLSISNATTTINID